MRLIPVAILLIFSLSSFRGNVQTGNSVTSVTASVQNIDLVHGTATVEIINQSNKDVTAYSLAIEEVLQDRRVIHSERMMDYGAFLAARGEVLHPGQASTQLLSFSPAPSNPLASISATVVAVVFADQTSEVSESDAFSRIADHRVSVALMTRTSVEAVKAALADTKSQHPGASAGSLIRDRINRSSKPTSTDGIDKEYMKAMAKDLEDAPNKAASNGLTEREYLAQRLADLQKRVQQEEAYAQIRRRQ